MPSRRTVFAAALLITMAGFAVAADEGPAGLDQAWKKAMLAQDVNAIANLYAADAIMFSPDQMMLKGREAIRKDYAANPDGDLKRLRALHDQDGAEGRRRTDDDGRPFLVGREEGRREVAVRRRSRLRSDASAAGDRAAGEVTRTPSPTGRGKG